MKRLIFIFIAVLLLNIKLFATTHIIQVSDFSFSPMNINAEVGDIIKWEWVSGNHTTTSVSVPIGAAMWDNPINSSSATFEIVVSVAGTYDYVCTPHSSMMTGTIIVSTATKLSEDSGEGFFAATVFPNPVKESTNIVISSKKNEKIVLKIFDLTGTVLYEESFVTETGKNNLIWNVKNNSGKKIKPGQYYYIIRSESGEKASGKILIEV